MVLVALEDSTQGRTGFTIAARVAAPDSGLVRALLGCPPTETRQREADLTELHRLGFAVGVDVDPSLLVSTSLAESIINVVAEQDPSLVLVAQRTAAAHPAFGGSGEAVAASVRVPVVILIGAADRIGEVVLVDVNPERPGEDGRSGAATVADDLAARIGGRGVKHRHVTDASALGDLRPGQLCIAPVDSWQVMASQDPPAGAALMMVLEAAPLVPHDERSYA
jgi:hypothetical protein